MHKPPFSLLLLLLLTACQPRPIKVLIVDGQNNHKVWPKSTVMMKQYLEETGRFTVTVERTDVTWRSEEQSAYLPLAGAGESTERKEPETDPGFAPDFAAYDVVISNFGWRAAAWPAATRAAFEEFVAGGGGFVSVHAADNSFPEWSAYNEMIGLGGWGDRDEKSGPYVYYDLNDKLVVDPSPGKGGAHGSRHAFPVTIREPNHPITVGLPRVWMTTPDECYAKLRGPAKNMTVLATGRDQSEKAPTQRNEPVLMTIAYGKGRIFHTTLGHDTRSFEGVGFITTLLRGTEWAATGKVSLPVPADFPTGEVPTKRVFKDLVKP